MEKTDAKPVIRQSVCAYSVIQQLEAFIITSKRGKKRFIHYSNAIATPILASLSTFLRSTLITLPLLIRANCPFSFAKVTVRGKLISTVWPDRTGVVIGTIIKTPVLLTLELWPLKNRFASGSQILTGQESCVRAFLRCSTTVSIILKLLYSFKTCFINHQSWYKQL